MAFDPNSLPPVKPKVTEDSGNSDNPYGDMITVGAENVVKSLKILPIPGAGALSGLLSGAPNTGLAAGLESEGFAPKNIPSILDNINTAGSMLYRVTLGAFAKNRAVTDGTEGVGGGEGISVGNLSTGSLGDLPSPFPQGAPSIGGADVGAGMSA